MSDSAEIEARTGFSSASEEETEAQDRSGGLNHSVRSGEISTGSKQDHEARKPRSDAQSRRGKSAGVRGEA